MGSVQDGWGVHPIGQPVFGLTFGEGIITTADPNPKRLTYARTSQNPYSRRPPENERLLACRELCVGRTNLSL